ncbi:UDP-N-acetylmuramate:L-alanyl-gamma-D-glutamyl-meso-diaminopimelate ligase [Halofilum ochraceum]|uniref:UDP-N-acetylmuramate:L-alanyl-gamma-D-glutamyl- meso-diaminopimelate ligase n=1 Tax=Halofilum ochraceum TaxID=1611323 RepID=UPI0008313A25|nr:UDP-N-acetylmuramate:L-alanyl-gamma-D-glutamyl-meso-diaminopimelate ligase [Halofilum ochraceum]
MHVHVLGICGTFMGGLAQLAAARGDRVTGADSGVYPPMSDQLEAAGIDLVEGWDPAQLSPAPDLVVVGNALSRGNPAVEAVLERGLPYTSGPAWLREHVLRDRHVVAVAGTHGKTTTASMVAHVLAEAGLEPGFLIGGVPAGFGVSARLGEGRPFVVEADEYDSAFFDKRSKFVHYGPRTLVLNNLEFDHADIFDDLAAIQRQFHHLVRTVPGNGRILSHAGDAALEAVLDQGCWTPVERFAPDTFEGSADWRAADVTADGSGFDVRGPDGARGRVEWSLLGRHNVANGLAAVAAARHAGADVGAACAALSAFGGVRRRLEVRGTPNGITVYDDFAHHPTAIATTLSGLRARVGGARIIAALDLASNSMRMGVHSAGLADALGAADRVYLLASRPLDWDPRTLVESDSERVSIFESAAALAARIAAEACPGDHVLLMSNSGFGGLPAALPEQLAGHAREGADGA